LKRGIAILFLGWVACADAVLPGQGVNRLFTVSEWNALCERLNQPARVVSCRTNLHRAVVNGRSLGPFELVSPIDPTLLQSRSGVLLLNHVNDLIVRVNEDSGMRTTLRLQDDTRCQTYAATSGSVGEPRADRSYTGLIKSWLDVYTDEASRVRSVSVGEHSSRQTLEFEALTEGRRVIRGRYQVDARTNAAIFATCDHPQGSVAASRNTELFFGAIVGSARRFI